MTVYITQWKGIAHYVSREIGRNIAESTIRAWHSNRLELPLLKSHPSKAGRVIVEKKNLDLWIDALLKSNPSLQNHSKKYK